MAQDPGAPPRDVGGSGQQQGTPLPDLPPAPRNAEGHPTTNPSGGGPHAGPLGRTVSPAVRRVRESPSSAQGHGSGGQGGGK